MSHNKLVFINERYYLPMFINLVLDVFFMYICFKASYDQQTTPVAVTSSNNQSAGNLKQASAQLQKLQGENMSANNMHIHENQVARLTQHFPNNQNPQTQPNRPQNSISQPTQQQITQPQTQILQLETSTMQSLQTPMHQSAVPQKQEQPPQINAPQLGLHSQKPQPVLSAKNQEGNFPQLNNSTQAQNKSQPENQSQIQTQPQIQNQPQVNPNSEPTQPNNQKDQILQTQAVQSSPNTQTSTSELRQLRRIPTRGKKFYIVNVHQ